MMDSVMCVCVCVYAGIHKRLNPLLRFTWITFLVSVITL